MNDYSVTNYPSALLSIFASQEFGGHRLSIIAVFHYLKNLDNLHFINCIKSIKMKSPAYLGHSVYCYLCISQCILYISRSFDLSGNAP